DVVHSTEGNTGGGVIWGAPPTRRGLRPWHVRALPARGTGFLPNVKGKICGGGTPPAYPGEWAPRVVPPKTPLSLARTLAPALATVPLRGILDSGCARRSADGQVRDEGIELRDCCQLLPSAEVTIKYRLPLQERAG